MFKFALAAPISLAATLANAEIIKVASPIRWLNRWTV